MQERGFFPEEPGPRVYDCVWENGNMGLADRACPAPLCTAGLFAMWMISTTMMGEGSLVLLMHFNKAPGKTRLSVFQWLSSQTSPFRIAKEIPYSAPCPRQKTLGLKRHNHYASLNPLLNFLITFWLGFLVILLPILNFADVHVLQMDLALQCFFQHLAPWAFCV